MLKYFVSLCTLVLIPCYLSAQGLLLSDTELDFGQTLDTQTDSLLLSFTNTSPTDIDITEIRFYGVYESTPFWASETQLTVPANVSRDVWVYFKPSHNIMHDSEMIILTNGMEGNYHVNLLGQGRYANLYYQRTQNQSEEALKDSLKSILTENHFGLSYDNARDYLFMELDNQKENGQGAPVNTLEAAYTGVVKTGYVNRSEAQTTSPQFNTEHTFPQALFSSDPPMVSDLHHLFAVKASANSERGNKPFGNVSNPSWQDGGSTSDNSTFEPRDEQKGQAARAMLYFVLRYENYSNFLSSQEGALRQWHLDFPADDIQKTRNQGIFNTQGNRNPFVDYPQLIDRIQSISNNSVAEAIYSWDVSGESIDFGTVNPDQDITYTYLLMNTGNQNLDIQQIQVGSSQISVGVQSGMIAPGNAFEFPLVLNAPYDTDLMDTLRFTVNGSTPTEYAIPIVARTLSTGISQGWPSDNLPEIYPNPATDVLHISFPKPLQSKTQVFLYNLEGQTLEVDNLQQHKQMDMEDIAPGMYFLYIQSDKGTYVEKIWHP